MQRQRTRTGRDAFLRNGLKCDERRKDVELLFLRLHSPPLRTSAPPSLSGSWRRNKDVAINELGKAAPQNFGSSGLDVSVRKRVWKEVSVKINLIAKILARENVKMLQQRKDKCRRPKVKQARSLPSVASLAVTTKQTPGTTA